ncbi:hypothetical protein QYE76_042828 [Lolium multiflorum]|uniref:CCHC-type domain-containing protein n=1 Tax=Lolium multiflorum TaxID=4521 RepID=A0AAD8TFJ1_LOLMU|nr:hypothetical protein QYE76_042828 [Lolium multiflorum]
MSSSKWTAGFPSFAEKVRWGEERRRREEEAKMAEGRRLALLRRKLLILQISLASEWALEQMAKGWRPQISGQGLEEQVAAALAMIKAKDPEDPRHQMAEQGLEDLENWKPRELVLNRSFTPADCYPAGRGFLPKATVIKFSDLWGAAEGKRSFVVVVSMAGGGRGAGRFGGGTGRGSGGGRAPPAAAATSSAAPSAGAVKEPVVVKSEFPPQMMQQLGAGQGMFPMLQPHMWNMPMNQWPQFFGSHQIPQPGFNPVMMVPQGIPQNLPQSNSQGSSASMVPLQQPQGSGAGKNKKKTQKNVVSDGSRQSGDKGGANLQISVVGGPGPVLDPKFKNVTCYNCGELGHYMGLCTRIKRCFICSKTGHYMDNCLMWYSLLPTAQYWGSANPGLGFFHVEVEGPEAVQWLNMDNVGVVVIKEGEISADELEKCFIDMWKANWFWQIRQIGPKKFLVRFPPSKRIKDLVEYPSINLKKDGVVIYFENWEGEAEPFEEFQEIWIKIYGIPAKWLTWKTVCQISTSLGVLVNIDWQGIFRSFYEEVRVKVAVRDKTKIPTNKLFEMEQCFYLVNFVVENEGEAIDVDEEDDDGDSGLGNKGDTVNDDDEIGDDFKSLDKGKNNGANNKMETESSMPLGGRSELHSAVHQKLEVSVQEKVLGKEPIVQVSNALVLRGAEENIGKNLLQHFDDESDEEVDVGIQEKDSVVLNNPAPMMPPMAWKEKKIWGPVQATRMSSRITRDGKSAIEKAQDLKKAKNLEIPKVYLWKN